MRVFIGWDAREDVAYQVARYSILRNTRSQVEVKPLKHKKLRKDGAFYRPWGIDPHTGNPFDLMDMRPFSTEFSHSRFLVPYLCDYKGWALFMDCDMVFQGDIKDLFAKCDDKYAVMCVKHNHRPEEQIKMDDVEQTKYPRKNWSSFMLINCGHHTNRALTKETVNTQSGTWLHGFEWLQDCHIGHLGFEYNWIENVSPGMDVKNIQVIHYTLGGPWFENYQDVMHAEVWKDYYERYQRDYHDYSNVPSVALGG